MKKRSAALFLTMLIMFSLIATAAFADGESCTVTVPTGIQGLFHKVYENGSPVMPEDTALLGGAVYKVSYGSDVEIVFSAASGYKLSGRDTIEIRKISSDTNVDSRLLPVAEKSSDVGNGGFLSKMLGGVFGRIIELISSYINMFIDLIKNIKT